MFWRALALLAVTALPSCASAPFVIAYAPATPAPAAKNATFTPADVDAVLAEVVRVRGLTPTAKIDVMFASDDEFRLLYRSNFTDDDLRRDVLFSHSDVDAFYSWETGAVVVRTKTREDPATLRGILAHELTHALQAQHFPGLRVVPEAPGRLEAYESRHALLEGDADVVRIGVEALHAGRPVRRAILATLRSPPTEIAVTGAPRNDADEGMLFPYVQGKRFVAAIYGAGGFALVDRVMSSKPPLRTSDILHPDRYLAGPAHRDLAGLNEIGMSPATSTSQGEFGVFVTLTHVDVPRAQAFALAAGWQGDVLSKTNDARVWTVIASNADRLEPYFAKLGAVVRRGDVLTLAIGTPDDARFAEEGTKRGEASALLEEPAPFGTRTIPAPPPDPLSRVATAWTRIGSSYVFRDFGLRLPGIDGATVTPRANHVLFVLHRAGPRAGEELTAAVELLAMRGDEGTMNAAKEVFLRPYRDALGSPTTVRDRDVSTPMGPGVERVLGYQEGSMRLLLLRACRGEAIVAIWALRSTPEDGRVVDAWLSGIDAKGMDDSLYCRLVHEDQTVELP